LISVRRFIIQLAAPVPCLTQKTKHFKERNRRAYSKLELVGVRVALGKKKKEMTIIENPFWGSWGWGWGLGRRSGPSLAGLKVRAQP